MVKKKQQTVKEKLALKRGGANGASKKNPSVKKEKRVSADLADYYAAQLHELREVNVSLKKAMIGLDSEILGLKQEILRSKTEAFNAEVARKDTGNAELRKKHSLTIGDSIHLDDETGEAYRVAKD